eukprot:TRINITY_DN28121_c0_g1_i1.p1 TRINITY_DN28121_c0_g1~~TRINITY_DN28121_c0_g1_i1.p1  ORF type:complete len:409 (+),score=41.65 TRINITY_DN28121_c0_g1_i1:60-1229(+)
MCIRDRHGSMGNPPSKSEQTSGKETTASSVEVEFYAKLGEYLRMNLYTSIYNIPEILAKENISPTKKTPQGLNILHAILKDVDRIENPTVIQLLGFFKLHYTVELQKLINEEAHGKNCVHYALNHRNSQIVQILFNYGGRRGWSNNQHPNYMFYFAYNRVWYPLEVDTNALSDMIRCLELAGDDIKQFNSQDQTLLHLACYNNDYDLAVILMPRLQHLINHQDKLGNTPLFAALGRGNLLLSCALADHKADPLIRNEKTKENILHVLFKHYPVANASNFYEELERFQNRASLSHAATKELLKEPDGSKESPLQILRARFGDQSSVAIALAKLAEQFGLNFEQSDKNRRQIVRRKRLSPQQLVQIDYWPFSRGVKYLFQTKVYMLSLIHI